MRKQRTKFRSILEETRAWAEVIAFENPDSYKIDLCGLCSITTKELHTRLKAEGLSSEIACNDRHCFLIYRNRIVDLTATQFDEPRIFISKLSGKEEGYWKIDGLFDNIEDVSNYQEELGWYEEQIILK